MPTLSFVFEQFVKASPSHVYHAFTNATVLRQWLCDLATVNPRPNGRFYASWNSGFYACGEYTVLETGKEVAFTWFGRGDPAATLVKVAISAQNGGSRVVLTHDKIGEGEEWERTVEEVQEGWKSSLENLSSVLETGEDLRFTLRPMIGINLGDYGPEIAARLGIPVSEGIRLDNVVDGLGAQAAGLQKDDVLVKLAGVDLTSYADLTSALQGKRAGDTIEVVFYRGMEKKTIMMELSRRPIPDIPSSLASLADVVKERYDQLEKEIDTFFASVSEEDAGFKPAPEEWSVKEVLAHLLQGERYFQFHSAEMVGSQESWTDDFAGNLDAQVRATVAAFPTLKELLDELKRLYKETITLYANLPSEFFTYKGNYWRLAYEALQAPYHYYSHFDQMRKALEAARE